MTEDQRKTMRKVLVVKAALIMEGQAAKAVRTTDISANGVGLVLAHPVQAGQLGQLAFAMYLNGATRSITSKVKATHCIYSGGEFKAGFAFAGMEPPSTITLSLLLGSR